MTAPPPSLASLAGKPALSAALRRLEVAAEAEDMLALLSAAYHAPRAHVVGITGPPGVGKSTLISALIAGWRAQGRTVACIAVDPSSRRSGGALLGDRARLATDPADPGVFVRSMAARDRLGGLATLSLAAMVLLRALYDIVLIETVGVGQSETDIDAAADTVLLCVQPGAGDSLQFLKAGIVEVPHIVVVTKSDLGALARRARADIAAAMHMAPAAGDWTVPVLAVAADRGEGIDALIEAIGVHAAALAGDALAAARHAQAERWMEAALRERFGSEGCRRAGRLRLPPGVSPFRHLAETARALAAGWPALPGGSAD